MLLADVASVSAAVGAVPGRTAKVALLSDALRTAAPDELPVAVAYLTGELRQRKTGVGYAALSSVPSPADEPALTLLAVDAAFAALAAESGAGSTGRRAAQVAALFGAATAPEQRLLAGLIGGELRQGAQAGLMVDAVARAAEVPVAAVRRALTLCGSLRDVAVAALVDRDLSVFALEVGRPLAPMLASPAADLDDALAQVSPAAVEWKLDGIRVQVHRRDGVVSVFSRSLDDITAKVPAVVAAVAGLPGEDLVLDGEALAVRPDGRPEAFQVSASRGAQVVPYFFDVLHGLGRTVLDEPLSARIEVLEAVVPAELRAPRLVTVEVEQARAFAADALARGHEGVVVKALDVPYEAGRRGASWLKVKPRHTLDLVVLGAEWGHGRRAGWLSNLHLGARTDDGFVMLGKTFKGLTDKLLRWQTARFLELESSRNEWQVLVRPEQVVEVAFDGVQRSTRYPGGVTLRFARVLRYRDDKPAAEADTLDAVRAMLSPG
ncbi:MAG: putative ligase [Frankiales bacterium]|nr:putative ligase [Frankiales bacterium]